MRRYVHRLKDVSVWLRILSAIFLLLAIAGLDWDFYIILRWVVCPVTLYCAVLANEQEKRLWLWTFGFMALLFNPLAPVHLNRVLWQILDFVASIILLISIFVIGKTAQTNIIKSADTSRISSSAEDSASQKPYAGPLADFDNDTRKKLLAFGKETLQRVGEDYEKWSDAFLRTFDTEMIKLLVPYILDIYEESKRLLQKDRIAAASVRIKEALDKEGKDQPSR